MRKALLLGLGALAMVALALEGRGLAKARRQRRVERHMKIQPLKQTKLTTHGFGRYVINLPEGTRLVNWHQTYQGTGPIRVAKGVTAEQFEDITQQRANELRSTSHKNGGPLLERVVDLGLPYAKAMTYWESKWILKERLIECDAFYLLDETLYRFQNTINLDPARQAKYFSGFKDMLEAIRPRRPDELPSDPGSCFDGAILLDGPDRDYSEIVMATGLWPDRPDVRFQLAVLDNGTSPDPPLLTRLEHAGALRRPGVLRSGDRIAAEVPGQEHLERVTEKNGTEGHLFIWETQGLSYRFDRPQIRVEMTTGEGRGAPQDSTLSDEDALALWDQIVDSLHWRLTMPPTIYRGPRGG